MQNWSTIKQGLFACIKLFFEENYLEQSLNHTHICLKPKTVIPMSMKDYRPISLCIVAYKVISKILAERLKPCLHKIISENQSASIPGRCISDNILIAHELLHSLHTKKLVEPSMALKLDITKAFDHVEWNYLEEIMARMGFCTTWRSWIMNCITSVSYSILLNGVPSGKIYPQIGIRQGTLYLLICI